MSRARAAVRAAFTAVRDRESPRAPTIASSMPWWNTRSATVRAEPVGGRAEHQPLDPVGRAGARPAGR